METASRACFVVDSSVASKWHLHDEEYSDVSVELLTAFRKGQIDLIAPDHIRYEVPSAIRKIVRTGRLTTAQARKAISDFLEWNVPTVGGDELILAGYEQTVRFGCSLYDGLNVALADALQRPLVHADSALRNALGPMFSHAIWIEDWSI